MTDPDDFPELPLPDEDYAFEQYRQRRVDEGSWTPRPSILRKTPSFQRGYGVQQYSHSDPAPLLPFANAWEPPRYTRLEVWTVRAMWLAVILALLAAEVLA
jgi:hypothetical protein